MEAQEKTIEILKEQLLVAEAQARALQLPPRSCCPPSTLSLTGQGTSLTHLSYPPLLDKRKAAVLDKLRQLCDTRDESVRRKAPFLQTLCLRYLMSSIP